MLLFLLCSVSEIVTKLFDAPSELSKQFWDWHDFVQKTFWTHNTIALCQSEIALLPVQAAKRLFLDFIYLSLFFFLMCLYISHLSSKSQAFLTCCENATLSPLFTSTNVVSNPFRTLFHQNSYYYLVEVKSVRLVGNLQTRRKTEWFDMFVRLC